MCDWAFEVCGTVPPGGEPGCNADCGAAVYGAEALDCMRIAYTIESCEALPACSDAFVLPPP